MTLRLSTYADFVYNNIILDTSKLMKIQTALEREALLIFITSMSYLPSSCRISQFLLLMLSKWKLYMISSRSLRWSTTSFFILMRLNFPPIRIFLLAVSIGVGEIIRLALSTRRVWTWSAPTMTALARRKMRSWIKHPPYL